MKIILSRSILAAFVSLGAIAIAAEEKSKPAPANAPEKGEAAPAPTEKKRKVAPAGAAEQGKASGKIAVVSDYPFWTTKKRGASPQFVPGLNAALLLSDAQKQQIAEARNELTSNEEVKAARSLGKSDPNVTPEQRQKAQEVIATANAKLSEKVAAILTPEQKTLVEKINAAYAAAVEETGIVYEDKFATIKADPAARQRVQQEKNEDTEEQFLHKLDGILSAEQKEAMNRAAEEEVRRAASAPKKPAKS